MSWPEIYLLLPAFVMCLILVGIHCYLGLHVLKRNILFVDLALAQVAALGGVVGLVIGLEHHPIGQFAVSLGFTFVAALLFTAVSRYRQHISPETYIGIVYAFASAFVVLLFEHMSHGSEHMKDTLVGQILWTSWQDVLTVGCTYSVVSIVHYVFRHQFIKASETGSTNWIWDFCFFSLFGVVITCSVKVSGVLLVFAFLVVPALLSSLLAKSWRERLLTGWAIGFLLCSLGILLSLRLDLPPGATLVVVFTILPVLIVPWLRRR